ncbi:replication protein [Burkholderia vietnamiensis]|nr:replication protein [Burkholderia vietnamiensis]
MREGKRHEATKAGDLFSGLSASDAGTAAAAPEAPPPAAKKPASKPAKLPAVIERKPSTKPATAREAKLIDAATEIASARPEGDDLSFMHSIMCQVGLPRSRVVGTEFERRSGTSILSVEAGKVFDGKNLVVQPVPYGPMPRLMLVWLNTYAVRHRTPEVPIGDSASEFMRMLGVEPGGGKRGSYTTFRKQAQALAACRMTLGYMDPNGQPKTFYGKPISSFSAWAKDEGEHGKQRPLWPGVMQFSVDYYETLIKHAVPIDVRALTALKGSALAMDIYTMLADRLHRITGRPLILYWANVREQFGQEYQGKNADKDFKAEFLKALKAVLAVYPQAKVTQVTGGLMLMASPPPIPYKGQ